MEIRHEKYDNLIDGQSVDFRAGIDEVVGAMNDRRSVIESHEDRFLPDMLES